MAERKKALFVGNDINNAVPGYSWSDLLDELIRYVNAEAEIKRMSSHFPLFYEQIWAHSHQVRNGPSRTELEIKEFIANRIKGLRSNEIHDALMELDCAEILTTNYDFCLERVRTEKPAELENEARVTERRYSRFRRYRVGGSRIWHLHGDAFHPASIALGYEHYSGYLQNLRNYVTEGASFRNHHFDPLLQRLKRKGALETFSWLDVFFSHDVHMLGFGLDYSEIHLWWWLTFLSRGSREGGKSFKYEQQVYYYVPSFIAVKAGEKLRLLKTLGFKVVEIEAKPRNMQSYYLDAIRRIKRR